MSDMYGVINTETNCKDNVDAGDDVNGDAPEMEKSNNISESGDHNEDDHNADLNVAEK